MDISVTAFDIKNGVPRDGDHCAIAMAVSRCNGWKPVTVSDIYITIGEPGKMETYATPHSVASFVKDFDAGESVEPFDFILIESRQESRQNEAQEVGK